MRRHAQLRDLLVASGQQRCERIIEIERGITDDMEFLEMSPPS